MIEATGVEAKARGDWSARAGWRLALNYTDAEFGSGPLMGLRPAQSPEWSASAGFDWRPSDTTTLSAAVRVHDIGRHGAWCVTLSADRGGDCKVVLAACGSRNFVAACGEASQAPSAPSSSRVTAPPVASQPAPDRCEHGMPPAICPKCNPGLAAVYQSRGDWCPEHGFPESLCPLCKPDVKFPDVGEPAAAPADWCGGHGLPESKCTKCNPSLVEKFKASGDWCDEHGFPDSVCAVCNPQAPPPTMVVADWCVEHGLPESQCRICSPDTKIVRPPPAGEPTAWYSRSTKTPQRQP